jgi:outer membrane immunogenic protein
VARASANLGGVDLSDNGYFLGIGADYALTDQWTLGGEVMAHRFNDFAGTGARLDATTVQAKVAFRF